jgi:Acetyltransferase (GNAT) domain
VIKTIANRDGDAELKLELLPFSAERYDALLEGRPETTLFHTRLWAQIVTETFGALRDCSRIVRCGDREYGLPLFQWRRLGGLLATNHSSFPFLYGSLIPYEPAAAPVLRRWMDRQWGSHVLMGNPFADETKTAPATGPSETTHLLELPNRPEDFWEGILTSRKRNDIRRLTRKGVTITATREPGAIESFYYLYQKRMGTWAQAPGLIYPISLYQNLIRLGGESVRLYMVTYEGQVIGGTMICRYNGITHYLAGYFDHDASRLRPNVLVQDRIIQDAIGEGQRVYDMLPSAGIESVVKFKESFGGTAVRFDRWERHDLLQRIRRQMRR